MPPSASPHAPLTGLRVLVPRGGTLGNRLADAVRAAGGDPVVVPMIEFTEPRHPALLEQAVAELGAGRFDWVAVTSATTVDVLVARGVRIPAATRVAAVGPATRDALLHSGFRVDFVPSGEFSAAAMVAEWPPGGGRVLVLQSDIASPKLVEGLAAIGAEVHAVTAYETHALPIHEPTARHLRDGEFDAVLVTSGSVARAVAGRCATVLKTRLPESRLPETTLLACIGEPSATAARAAGLRVDVVAEMSGAKQLVDALSARVLARSNSHSRSNSSPNTPRWSDD